jgi:hypothetical protein
MTDDEPRGRPGRVRRFLRRWGGACAGALALAVASQLLWWWQTWPVRQLVDAPPAQAAPAR